MINIKIKGNLEVDDDFPVDRLNEFIDSWKRELSYVVNLYNKAEIISIYSIKLEKDE